MGLTETEMSEKAHQLVSASKELKAIDPFTASHPEMTVGDAYRIQLATVDIKVSGGRKVVGKKIGLTSPAMQEMFGVNEPDYGHLLDDMLVYQDEGISASQLLQPRVEGEIAFILNQDLIGPGVTTADVLCATRGVSAALEIIDSRIRDWKVKIQDTIADNASSGKFVLSSRMIRLEDLDLRYVGFVMNKNGRQAATGAGAAVLGSPVQAVAWLANKMGEFGISLNSGEVILSGSAVAAVPVQEGDHIQLMVDRVGDVGCFFT